MYNNEYYPELLVDKIKGYIETVISFLEEQTCTYDEIQKVL
ncbi:DUF5713 family protein [Metaclostridioides mangenotii]|nr:DUF5713 family protein [Clostridioides mangenotii]